MASEPVDTSTESSLAVSSRTPRGRRFALRYAAISSVLFTFYCFPYEQMGISERPFVTYLNLYARLVGSTLSVLGESVVVSDSHIHGRFPLQMVRNCDAIEVMILFSGAVLAIDASWVRRSVALLAGLLAIVAMNVARIVGLFYVGVHAQDAFATMHEEVFPLVLVACAACLLVVVLGRLATRRGAAAGVAAVK
jgi:exosortase/archaeosortase family protein